MNKVLILYQFYAPDDVVSAQQFTGLAEGLAAKGWEVETWPCNRKCHPPGESYSLEESVLNGVRVRRVWRPNFPQHSFWGRIFNAVWMLKAWFLRALFTSAPEAVVIGADPIFSILLVPFLKLRWPRTKFAHWCFDLYPEYPIAEGMAREGGPLVGFIRMLLRPAYRQCDLVADIGSCMREKLARYPIRRNATLTPWSLEEPPGPMPFDKAERAALFGDAALGLLYSGNLSHPHDFYLTLKLARLMSHVGKKNEMGYSPQFIFVYSARGNRLEELKRAVNPEYTNLRFAAFAPPERLAARLSAPDVHLVSLKASYTGVAVPSKFFGALAAGRPVLFEGDPGSAIARWIGEYRVGWVLTHLNLEEVAADLSKFSKNPQRKDEMFRRCHEVYQAHFSKADVLARWDRELRSLLS